MDNKLSIDITKCFICYVEINDINYRLVFNEKSDEKNKTLITSGVGFEIIFLKLRQICDNKDIGFQTHLIQILDQKTKKFVRIQSTEQIKNGSKIRFLSKDQLSDDFNQKSKSKPILLEKSSKETKRMDNKKGISDLNLLLIKSIKKQLSLESVANAPIDWQRVSNKIQSNKEIGFSPIDYKHQFHSIIGNYLSYLSESVNKNHNKFFQFDNQFLEVFEELDSMCLETHIKQKTFNKIKQLTNILSIKKTIDWLLIQTTNSMIGLNSDQNQQTIKADDKSQLKLLIEDKTSLRSALVTQITKQMTTNSAPIDWTLICQSMQTLGFEPFDELYYKTQFHSIISVYMSLMKSCDNEFESNNEWSLFRSINAMDLKQFCSKNTFKRITQLKARFESKLDCISIKS